MALLMVDQGEGVSLAIIVNKVAPQDLVLHLYKNDKTPADGDTEDDYEEATFSGYVQKGLAGANWTVTPGAPSEAAYPQQTFLSDQAQTVENVYGYYITQSVSEMLIWAERFPLPCPIYNNNDAVKVTPKIQLRKQGE
jgi:hypothetical protein